MSTNLDNFIQYMVRKAESLRLDAGYSGAMDDGVLVHLTHPLQHTKQGAPV